MFDLYAAVQLSGCECAESVYEEYGPNWIVDHRWPVDCIQEYVKPVCPGCVNMLQSPYEHHYTCDLSIDFIRKRQAALREPDPLKDC